MSPDTEPKSGAKLFVLVVLVQHAVADNKVEPLSHITGLHGEPLKSGGSVFAPRCHRQNLSVADVGKVPQLFGNVLCRHTILPATFQDSYLPFTKIVLLHVGFSA